VQAKYGSRAIVYGAWVGGKPITVGAVGNSRPGVPATSNQHFRVGNTAEWLMGTLLLRFVDQHKLALDDPIARWYPDLPDANDVTVRMLVNSTSGYNDFVTTDAFDTAFRANPFQQWQPDALIAIGMSKPPLFAPGTSWAFSDTNFLLLAQILQKVTGQSIDALYQENLFSRLGMRQSRGNAGATVPAPALHGWETQRGKYEDATNWNPSWLPGVVEVTSTVGDLGRWTRSFRSVLSPSSARLVTAPLLAGTGPLTRKNYYAFGKVSTNGWIASNPQLVGYNGIVAYLPSEKLSLVIYTTLGPKTNPAVAAATAVFLKVAHALTPGNIPGYSVLPRGTSGSQ
jgi:D-alanyl-D-alanine carboxypeptidase